jgi:hypothetical protein
MGSHRAPDSARQVRRGQAHSCHARGGERFDVCSVDRLPVAGDPQGSAAALDDAWVFRPVDLWTWDGTITLIHHALYVLCRERVEREASPTAAIIDSQSVKSAEKGGSLTYPVTMRAKRSKARSGIFSSILRAS